MKIKNVLCLGMAVLLTCSNQLQIETYAQEMRKENVVIGQEYGEGKESVFNAAEDEYQYNELEDGTLEITGYIGNGTDLVIPEEVDGWDVTRIGSRAFTDKYNLKSVVMPDSITDIGEDAFKGCRSLQNIKFPAKLRSIKSYAFWGCTNLTEINLPDGLTDIGIWAFENCRSLTAVSIPDGVISIGTGAFCRCENLGSVSIPDSVKNIGGHAFEGTNWLESEREKDPCVIVSGILIDGRTCSGIVDIPQGVRSIADTAFHGCAERLTGINIPPSVTDIGEASFVDCISLADIEIPEGTKSIGDRAFYGCSGLINIRISSSVESVGAAAFEGTNWLENEREKDPCVIVNNILIDGRTCSGNVSILDGVKILAGGAFSECKDLKIINIPESVTSIGSSAFIMCSSLTDINIPASVTSIGSSVFNGCSSLTGINIPASVTSIGSSAFNECSSLTGINIPASVTSIGSSAFYGCSSLTGINIPASVTSIGRFAFENCSSDFVLKVVKNSYAEMYAQKNNIAYLDINGLEGFDYEEEEDGSVAITEYSGGDVNVVIPSEIGGKPVSSVRSYVFQGNSDLKSITFPDGITEIGSESFRDCWQLSKVELPAGLTKIGDFAFSNCDSLSSIKLPEEVTKIGRCVFSDCENLRDVELSAGLTEIDDNAFGYCGSLENIKFPENLKRIGNEAFYDCSKLSDIQLPAGLTTLGCEVFVGCENLKNISIPKSVINIGERAFQACNKDLVLSVHKGSYAEVYAKENGHKYSYAGSGEIFPCTHTFSSFLTKAMVGKNGVITKTCVKCGEKTTITIYMPKTVKLSKTSFTYNNRNQKPSVIIKDSQGKVLSGKTDYVVIYSKGMKSVGKYILTIKFKGNYSGTVKKTFTIVPKGVSISKVTSKKKGFTVKWKKQTVQTVGYQIAYSTDSKFSSKNTKIVSVGKNKTTLKIIGKINAKKKYYVRVRTYKTVKGKKYYSGWSKIKSVITK